MKALRTLEASADERKARFENTLRALRTSLEPQHLFEEAMEEIEAVLPPQLRALAGAAKRNPALTASAAAAAALLLIDQQRKPRRKRATQPRIETRRSQNGK